jgi:hypothetical protein
MNGACTPESECQPLACVVGRADCDADPSDCEAELEQQGACGPVYVGTMPLSSDYTWLALGPDGSSLATMAGKLYKFSAEGDQLWTYSSPRGEVSRLALDAGNSVFVAGYWLADAGEISADIGTFITKLNAEGEPAWEAVFEPVAGAGQALYEEIAVDGSGSVLLAATLSGDVDVDPTSGVDVQHFDSRQTWLFEFDSNGEVAWARALDAGADPNCQASVDALVRSAGRILVAGTTVSGCTLAGEGAPAAPGDEVGFIASLSSSGAADRVRWLPGANTGGGGTANAGGSLVAYADGAVALVASVTSELYLDDPNQLLAEVQTPRRFVARFSADLELQWLKVAAWLNSPQAAPGGGLMALFEPESPTRSRVLTRWREDGSSAWTLPVGCQWIESAGAAGEIFAARSLGQVDPGPMGCDLDSGPDVATTTEGAQVVTYRF